jgi:hypothetical protein
MMNAGPTGARVVIGIHYRRKIRGSILAVQRKPLAGAPLCRKAFRPARFVASRSGALFAPNIAGAAGPSSRGTLEHILWRLDDAIPGVIHPREERPATPAVLS